MSISFYARNGKNLNIFSSSKKQILLYESILFSKIVINQFYCLYDVQKLLLGGVVSRGQCPLPLDRPSRVRITTKTKPKRGGRGIEIMNYLIVLPAGRGSAS